LHDPFGFSESRVVRVLEEVPKGESIRCFKNLLTDFETMFIISFLCC